MTNNPGDLLQIDKLRVIFESERGQLQALCDVSLTIGAGEIVGLVGETGCGKSLVGLSILRLIQKPGKITAGKITFRGENLLTKSEADMRRLRGAAIAMIFQDPSTSLNPLFSVGKQLIQVLQHHRRLSKVQARAEVLRILTAVGLPDSERIARAYPHELSGGMQQRVMISMALLCQPALIIADEPTTALDVTIQAQILVLLRDLRDQLGISILLISHNLGIVANLCNRLAVLYAGRVVEIGTTADLFNAPSHPYTRGLIAAIPQPERRGQPLMSIPGTVPANPGAVSGCAFAPRCPFAFDRCRAEQPALFSVSPGHQAACFLVDQEAIHEQ